MKTLAILAVALTLAACDKDRGAVYDPDANNTVVVGNEDECPRADGQPCQ